MSPSPVNFASDNSTGAAPEVLAALIAANDHRTMPYGNDHHPRAAEAALAEVFRGADGDAYRASDPSELLLAIRALGRAAASDD